MRSKAVKKCKATSQAYRLRREAEAAAAETYQRMFTMQQVMDWVQIAANEEFGFGADRLQRLVNRTMQVADECAGLVLEDSETDISMEYAKDLIDRKLKQICGKNFVPWDERYSFSGGGSP